MIVPVLFSSIGRSDESNSVLPSALCPWRSNESALDRVVATFPRGPPTVLDEHFVQTSIPKAILETSAGKEADAILRRCVHCGFCAAVCPTYELLGDENDSPRGRIYLIKELLEGRNVAAETRLHLDRCLTCRACETACPSGVEYHRLADLARDRLEQRNERPLIERLVRFILAKVLPYPMRFRWLLRLGRLAKPLLPASLKKKIPPRPRLAVAALPVLKATPARTMILLEACAQEESSPNTNAAARRVLGRLGIELKAERYAGCCGALSYHLARTADAEAFMRANIDAWWPQIEAGAEAIVSTASGCGAMLKEYDKALAHDSAYAQKAKRIASLAKDLSEVVAAEDRTALRLRGDGRRVAFHPPCTLQHGQRLTGVVEPLLQQAGFVLTKVPDAQRCCGAAGTYSMLQPELAEQLITRKVAALSSDAPDVVATANVGCELYIAGASELPVRHWIELLDEASAP